MTVIFSLLIIANSCIAQSVDSNLVLLLNLKNTIERHFSGTNTRGLREPFKIEYNNSTKKYTFTSRANDVLSLAKSRVLNLKINQSLKNQPKRKLVGKIYFDKHLDSSLVDIEILPDEEVYQFRSMNSAPEPPGGLSTFSRRLHDFLIEKIAHKQLLLDSILAKQSIRINVSRDGHLQPTDNGTLSSLIDVFMKTERRWNPGLGGSVDAQVEFNLISYYLKNKAENWPNSDDFSNHVNVRLILRNKIGLDLTFYSTSFPVKFNSDDITIVSFAYDGMLEKYRYPSTHKGNLADSNKLINDMLKMSAKENSRSDLSFERIYFYRN